MQKKANVNKILSVVKANRYLLVSNFLVMEINNHVVSVANEKHTSIQTAQPLTLVADNAFWRLFLLTCHYYLLRHPDCKHTIRTVAICKTLDWLLTGRVKSSATPEEKEDFA